MGTSLDQTTRPGRPRGSVASLVPMTFSNIMDSNSYQGDSPAEPLIEAGERLPAPANRLFYDRPVHLVRGQGSHLYDADGVCFLDAYNNVDSVGNCHQHVSHTGA